MSKFTKLPFFLSNSLASEPFELIHMDIWGPYREYTRNKYRHFMTIVDDNTRTTWISLLEFKSDSLSTLETFLQYSKNHFGKSVKFLRTDNALEFDDSSCKKFFSDKGIVHQTSCVKRPQQNARVERKHRHFLEMARALRFQASLPLKYWGDCVMTAAYIINRLPIAVLNNKTPYEALNKKPPSYTNMKVFGCLAFACNPAYTTEKFSPRGVPCVFLGYPATQKGYRLLNLLTMLTFISRDVTFHETIFPFSSTSKNSYMQPLPEPCPKNQVFLDELSSFSDSDENEHSETSPVSTEPESQTTSPNIS